MLRTAAFARTPASGGHVRMLTALLLASALPARAQEAPADPHAVQPERPTVATHAGTVAPGWLEIETGLEADRYTGGSHGALMPVVFKLGMAPRLQLDLFESVARPPGAARAGLGDLAAGLKWRISDRAGPLGRFAVLPIVKFATGSSVTGTGTTDITVVVISSHDVGSLSLDVNAGYTHRSAGGRAPRDAGFWTVSAGGALRGPVGWVAELYGYPATSGPLGASAIVALLAGPTVLVRPWLALDAGFIAPLTGPQPRALYLGAVWNAGRLWRAARPR